jgi:competence protein ComEA
MDAPTLTHLRVRARRDGFRRCGRAWPAAGVTVAADDFSDDELARLLGEPMLEVTAIAHADALEPHTTAARGAGDAVVSAHAAAAEPAAAAAPQPAQRAPAHTAEGDAPPAGGPDLAPVNINRATAAELADAMANVNASVAQRIIDFRDAHGPFAAVDELVRVSGIGPATVAANRARLTV